jgi:uncharacterized protein involved in outer membrane biogenesis
MAEPSVIPEENPPATHRRWRRRVLWIAIFGVLLGAAIVLPGLVNMSRYQRQVTALVGHSLGRPARLSGVELRLLPSPGFILHDLAVSEDPAFGAEPVLSARTVVASVRIFSLLRGKVEINRISVDEASLNLVRNNEGRWNLESLMLGAQPVLTAAPGAGSTTRQDKPVRFPYLEATSSRINLKQGAEKSPFSVADTDFSLWQDQPGQWRVRLKGQPVRTDIEMSQADTGLVRMEATLGTAESLRDMPLKLQMDWREAQLGQLSRLVSGADSGWRGDVRADIDVRGTVDAAQTRMRLQATGVRREEFAPATPQDFDANCSFRYQHSLKAFHDVGCDTSIGDGRLHLKAELPGDTGPPEAMLEVRQVQLQAVLELLRTVRGGFAPEMTARGTVNGALTYKEIPKVKPDSKPVAKSARKSAKNLPSPVAPGALTGSLNLDGVVLRGGALTDPLTLPVISLAPLPGARGSDYISLGSQFTVTFPIPPSPSQASSVPATSAQPNPSTSAGTAPAQLAPPAAQQPLQVRLRLNSNGYEAAFSGSAPTGRIRQLAYAFGLPHMDAADALTSGTADLDLSASGPWIAGVALPAAHVLAPGVAGPSPDSGAATDVFSGTLKLRHAEWRPTYLSRPVELPQGVVTLAPGRLVMTSDFSYGDTKQAAKNPLKGTVEVTASPGCAEKACEPKVNLHFGSLDASAMQAALLDASAKKSLLSPLLNRMGSGANAKLPAIALTVEAESFELGPLSVHKLNAHVHTEEHAIVLESWNAAFLGGTATGTGKVSFGDGSPQYQADGSFTGISGQSLGTLLGAPWSGGPLSGSGSVTLTGLNGAELAASATGNVKFDWPHGSAVVEHGLPMHFDRWTGAFTLKSGKAELGQNAVVLGKHNSTAAGSIVLGGAVKLTSSDAASQEATHKPVNPPAVQ